MTRFVGFMILAGALYAAATWILPGRQRLCMKLCIALVLSFAVIVLPAIVYWSPDRAPLALSNAVAWIVVILVHAALAARPAIREKSWKRLASGMLLLFLGITFPLFVFTFSALGVPEWKGACNYGWVNCLLKGKLLLLPILFWATAALWQVEINRTQNRTRPWIVLGLYSGSVVSGICTFYAAILIGRELQVAVWILAPAYVAIWYGIRAQQLTALSGLKPWTRLVAILLSIPFWIASIIWSKRIYATLPDTPPDCFVVTAASRGHRSIVGPLFETTRHGRCRPASQQLITLWELEDVWQRRAPSSHLSFRRVYNVVGPVIARHIRTPLLADMTFIGLKPIEWFGRYIIRHN